MLDARELGGAGSEDGGRPRPRGRRDRRAGPRRPATGDRRPATGDESPGSAWVIACRAERAAAMPGVREAVKTLTPAHRDVLVLVCFFGASVAEAAQTLGVPPGTVRSRAYYALRALRRALPDYAADLH